MRVLCDVEASGLIDYKLSDPFPKHLWCVVALDVDTGRVYRFVPDDVVRPKLDRPLSSFPEFSRSVEEWWFHNGVSYDVKVLNNHFGTTLILYDNVKDTLIYSKMIWQNRLGGHSLKALGEFLGAPKTEFDDWSKFSFEQLIYCENDVRVLARVREWCLKQTHDFTEESLRLEHNVRVVLDEMEENGFYLDMDLAQRTYDVAKTEADEIEVETATLFPPRPIADREFLPRSTKKGGIALNSTGGHDVEECWAGAPFTRIIWKEFSMASPMEKLWRLKGWWCPVVKTKSGNSWKICEENLDTLIDTAPPALKKMRRWSVLTARHKAIWAETLKGKNNSSWIGNVGDDGCVHGHCDGLGTYTQRAAHSGPNMANIPGLMDRTGVPAVLGREMRECWTVADPDKYCVVGTDASGVQLRVLAHYINNKEYTYQVVNGDIHTTNMQSLGEICKTRPNAKTFIYAWLLGAGVGKVSAILGCSRQQASQAMKRFVKNTKGLANLLERKTLAAGRGWMRGLDGRLVKIPSDHLSLPVYLQSGEAIIMKLAMVLWTKWAKKRKIDYKLCAFVHDEWQSFCLKTQAKLLGSLQVKSIQMAGKILNMNVELDAETKSGRTWADTH